MPVLAPGALLDERVEAIRGYHAMTGAPRAQLDLSGGIDSAVMAGLLTLAVGPGNLTLSHTIIHTNPRQTAQARGLARSIGAALAVGDFTATYEAVRGELLRSLAEAGHDPAQLAARLAADPTVEGSLRSCLRAPLGRGYNRMTGGGIRHGTGNECEDRFLRFYQKGGDGEVDTNPIEMLSKTEVYQLAHALAKRLDAVDGYRPIIDAAPTPDLWGIGDRHNDEDELLSWTGAPFTYGRIDSGTGRITSFGTIEMVSRFADAAAPEGGLFDDALPPEALAALITRAVAERERRFPGVEPPMVERLLRAARRVERHTRHKRNPGIPALGSRRALLDADILTDELTKG